jgi:hypothetical protein
MTPQQRGTTRGQGARWGAIALTVGALAVAGCSASASKNSASSGAGATAGAGGASATAGASGAGASGGSAGGSVSAAQAIRQAGQQAGKATSFAADVTVQTTGTASSTLSGTLQQQTEPSPLAVADFGSVSTQGQRVAGGIEEIINTSGVYLKMAQLSQQLGKPWIEIPASSLSKLSGGSFSQLLQNGSSDPLTQTQMLASSTDVKKVGPATINGVPTTEYTGTYPISAGLAKLPAATRSKIAAQLKTLGLTTEHFTVWLDDQQQVRKLVTAETGRSEQVATTIVVTSVNQPVSASIPPASETTTLPASLLGGVGSGTSGTSS